MSTSQLHTSQQTTIKSKLINSTNTWTIENFSATHGTIEMPTIKDRQSNCVNISLKKDDYFGYLSVTITSSYFRPYINLYILDRNREKCFEVKKYPGAFIYNYKRPGISYNIDLPEFISIKELLSRPQFYLPDDKLTLVCELRYTVDQKTCVTGDWVASIESAAQLKASEDMNQLLTTGVHADVTFLVGEEQLPAHKAILSVRSPVFAAMFSHNDTKEMLENKVEIKDVDVDAFKAMLAFIYTGKMPLLEPKLAENLLAAADKYQLEQLKTICENYLCDHLTIESAPNLLLLADVVNSAKLKEKCLEFIGSRSGEMIQAMLREPNQLVDMFRIMAQKNESKNTGDE